jgi:hypothetical protein
VVRDLSVFGAMVSLFSSPIGRLSVAHYKPTVTGAGATSNNLASATTVMYPT